MLGGRANMTDPRRRKQKTGQGGVRAPGRKTVTVTVY